MVINDYQWLLYLSTWLHYVTNNYWEDSWGEKKPGGAVWSPLAQPRPRPRSPRFFQSRSWSSIASMRSWEQGSKDKQLMFDTILRTSSETAVVPPHGTLSQVTVYETYCRIGPRKKSMNICRKPWYLTVQNTVFVGLPLNCLKPQSLVFPKAQFHTRPSSLAPSETKPAGVLTWGFAEPGCVHPNNPQDSGTSWNCLVSSNGFPLSPSSSSASSSSSSPLSLNSSGCHCRHHCHHRRRRHHRHHHHHHQQQQQQ